jgi:hypothetical protein
MVTETIATNARIAAKAGDAMQGRKAYGHQAFRKCVASAGQSFQ